MCIASRIAHPQNFALNQPTMPVKIKKPTKPAPAPPSVSKSLPSDDEDDFFASGPKLTALTPNTANQANTDDEDLDPELDGSDDSDEPEEYNTTNDYTQRTVINSTISAGSGANSSRDMDTRSNPSSGSNLATSQPAPSALDQQNQDVTTQQQKRKLPKVPSLRPSFKDACAWYAKLTPLQREHVIVYVYRTYPVIIKTDPKYIDIRVEPFDQHYIEDIHGGGKYTFYFLDTDLPKNNQLFGTTLEIDINYRAPILDYTELDITHAKNRSYVALLKRDGVLTMEGKVKETDKPNPNGDAVTMKLIDAMLADKNANAQNRSRQGDDIGAVMAKAMEMVTNTIRTTADQSSPDKMLGMMKTMLDLTKPAPQSNSDDKLTSMFMMFMKMQADSHAQMLELVKANHAQAAPSESTDPLDQLEKIAAVAEKLGFSRRNPPPPPPKDTLDKVLEYGAPVLQGVLGIIQQQLALPGASAAQRPPTPMSTPKGVGLIEEPNSNPLTQPTPPEDQEMLQLHMLLNQYGGVILSHMDGLEKTGDMFADALVGMVGMPTYNMVASAGPDKLFLAMKSHSEFWGKASLFGEAYLQEFCKTFCQYPELLKLEQQFEGLDEEIDPEPKSKKKPGVN